MEFCGAFTKNVPNGHQGGEAEAHGIEVDQFLGGQNVKIVIWTCLK